METYNIGRVGQVLKGEYTQGNVYKFLDVVTYEGSSYVSKIENNTSLPTDLSNWQINSLQGFKGWSPIFTYIVNGDFVNAKLTDYVGGEGEKPTTNIGLYLSDDGYTSDINEAINFRGHKGFSAYEVALNDGFVGTEEDWLNSLKMTYSDLTQADKEDLQKPLTDYIAAKDVEINAVIDASTEATNNAIAATQLTEQATTNANTATVNANQATTNANNKIIDVENRTVTAINNTITATDTQVQRVDSKIVEANTAITATNTATTNANQAAQTANNAKGWSPQFVFEEDGVTRLVMKLNDYVGGTGAKPTNNIGQYLTNEGTYTSTKTNGANFRGVIQIGSSTVVGGYKVGDTLVVSADGTLNVKPKVREYLNLTFSSNTSAFVFATENARANITDVFIEGIRLNSSQYEVVRIGLIRVKSLPKSVLLAQSYNVMVVGCLSTESQEFITEWEITDANKTITLPMTTEQTSNLTIDWGDGTINNSNTKTYATSGKKIVSIKGAVSYFRFNNSGDKLKIKDILNWGGFNINTSHVFYGCENLILNNVVGIPIISTSSFAYLFNSCKGITTINNINTWDVSSVTNMGNMFTDATVFNGDISNWDVSSVTNMYVIFRYATAFNGDISNWDVSSVTNMYAMLQSATAFNGDISNWDFSKVNSLDNIMFLKSYTNYNPQYVTNLYRRWTEFPNIANLTIGMGTCRYTPEGQQYKDILISRGNIITDGGVQQ